MGKVEKIGGVTIESHNDCGCGFLDDTYYCYNILHVWFMLNMEEWSLQSNENYILYKNYDLEIYSREFLDRWLSLDDIPYSYRIHYLNMKRYEYDRT